MIESITILLFIINMRLTGPKTRVASSSDLIKHHVKINNDHAISQVCR